MPPLVPPQTEIEIHIPAAPGGVSEATFKIDGLGRTTEFEFVAAKGAGDRGRTVKPFLEKIVALVKQDKGHLVPASIVDDLEISERRWNMIFQGADTNQGAFREVDRVVSKRLRDPATRRVVVKGQVHYQDANLPALDARMGSRGTTLKPEPGVAPNPEIPVAVTFSATATVRDPVDGAMKSVVLLRDDPESIESISLTLPTF